MWFPFDKQEFVLAPSEIVIFIMVASYVPDNRPNIHECISNYGGSIRSPMKELTAFQRDLLFVIAALNGPNGLAIKRELEEYYCQDIRHGRLYPNLDKLVEAGLVEKGERNARDNEYRLTDQALHWMRTHLDWASTCVSSGVR